MTSVEMDREFLIGYDKVANLSSPGYEADERSLFLTKAQERIIKRHYERDSNRLKKGFDETEKRRKDLSELIVDSVDPITGINRVTVSSSQEGALPNGKFFDLPDDVMYVLSEFVIKSIRGKKCEDSFVRVKPITYDEYIINRSNPFKSPYKELVWRLDYSKTIPNTGKKRHELITDGTYNIVDYRIRYIRKPKPIIVDNIFPKTIEGFSTIQDCELDSSLHREIVDEAISIALETAQEKRYQTQRAETQLSE